jgi:hypothetical protein
VKAREAMRMAAKAIDLVRRLELVMGAFGRIRVRGEYLFLSEIYEARQPEVPVQGDAGETP